MPDRSDEPKNMKRETERALEISRKKEAFREESEPAVKKILELIRSQCEPTIEAYGASALTSEDEQPRFAMNEDVKAALLSVPIPDVTNLTICFSLVLTELGYHVKVESQFYGTEQERTLFATHYIRPPVTAEAIQDELRSFLKDRSDAIRRLEEKRQMQK